jgi:transcriptional regulator with XRE-family HTH domain
VEILARRIRELRAERELSSERLAGRLEVSHKAVITWEKDRGDPSLANLLALAALFDVTPDYLLGLTDERSGPGDPPSAIQDSAEAASAKAARRRKR